MIRVSSYWGRSVPVRRHGVQATGHTPACGVLRRCLRTARGPGRPGPGIVGADRYAAPRALQAAEGVFFGNGQ